MKINGHWFLVTNKGKLTKKKFVCYHDLVSYAIKKYGQRNYSYQWIEKGGI